MKTTTQLLEEIKTLKQENIKLHKRLLAAEETIKAIKTGNIDALIVAHKKDIKIYTEQKAVKIYRVLLEKMHEGAVTLNNDGVILYSNSWFAKMVCLPLEKVIGAKFKSFIDHSSRKSFTTLFKKGWQGYAQSEVFIFTKTGTTIPVLMSVNTLPLENNIVLSIILTDLTLQNKKQAEFKSIIVEKIINVITEMNHYSDEVTKINYSEYIGKKLNHSYSYLAAIFSEVKGLTIQQFIINNKIEKAKELLLYGELNLSEISYKLNYSSVAHLSNQFKKVTGFAPSFYKRMKQKNFRIGP